MLIYISGPISGTRDYLSRFDEAENDILDTMPGVSIINPAIILSLLPTRYMNYKDITKVCLDLLSMCDGIYMLKDWETRKGAVLEHEYAVANNFEIFYQK